VLEHAPHPFSKKPTASFPVHFAGMKIISQSGFSTVSLCAKIQSANSPHQVAFSVGNMIRLLKRNHISVAIDKIKEAIWQN
jgi:hypothetical protein